MAFPMLTPKSGLVRLLQIIIVALQVLVTVP